MIRLSIIIPAYNAEKTIERCIVSCLKQGIDSKEFEIIAVDDGSKDHTLAVLNSLSQKFHNLHVEHQENQGQSVARNKALDMAKGEYICFVDADDYLLEKSLGKVLKKTEEKDADISSYLMNVQDKNGNWSSLPVTAFKVGEVYTGEYVTLHKTQAGSCCCSLFKKEFLNKYHLRFYPGIVHQDVEFTTRAHALAKRMIFTNITAYIYEYNFKSTTRDKNYKKIKKNLFDNVIISSNIKAFAHDKHKISEALTIYLDRSSNSSYISTFIGIYLNKDPKIKVFLNDYIRLGYYKGLIPIKGRSLSWKTTILIPLINTLCWFKIHTHRK